jgi:hypothetical protein
MASRRFKFYYDKDLRVAGNEYRDYTITVNGRVGNVRQKNLKKSFNLRVWNPCVDQTYVQLVPPVLTADVPEFTLFTGERNKVFF